MLKGQTYKYIKTSHQIDNTSHQYVETFRHINTSCHLSILHLVHLTSNAYYFCYSVYSCFSFYMTSHIGVSIYVEIEAFSTASFIHSFMIHIILACKRRLLRALSDVSGVSDLCLYCYICSLYHPDSCLILSMYSML